MKSIPFKIIEYQESYTFQTEGLNIREKEDAVLVNICESFPTPGYYMGISRIQKVGKVFIIYLNIIPPRSNAILLQVITYRKVTIEIAKKDLGDPPYNFKLIGGGFKGNHSSGGDRVEYWYQSNT